ncbi:MAG TPA: flagellar basal body rod C-terminal domain-containing protein [Acidimicrobiales bacterium]|nr:flagellar basal body rod C-terminal domain-containing protein [Acidimicrobiales bacterium]
MSSFGAIGISGSGIDAAEAWINTAAGNIANANDTVPTNQAVYAAQNPIFTPINTAGQVGEGVAVTGYALDSGAGMIQHDPTNPMHDANGNVRVANVDLASQMVGLIQAQEDYQVNASALSHAKQAYTSALTLGS